MRAFNPSILHAARSGRWLVVAALLLLAGQSWLGAFHRATAHADHAPLTTAGARQACEHHAGCGGGNRDSAESRRGAAGHPEDTEHRDEAPGGDCGVCFGLATLAKSAGVPDLGHALMGTVLSARGGADAGERAACVWERGARAVRGPPTAGLV